MIGVALVKERAGEEYLGVFNNVGLIVGTRVEEVDSLLGRGEKGKVDTSMVY